MKTPSVLRGDADKCRRLALGLADETARSALISLAEEYDTEATALESDILAADLAPPAT